MPNQIVFSIQEADITSFNADVLALKYAQQFVGTDEIIARLLSEAGVAVESLRPSIGAYRFVGTQNCIRSSNVLFVGVPSLAFFGYQYIQSFAQNVLAILSDIAPNTKHIATTIHGVGFGLDEIEAFLAQFKGYLQALQNEAFPSSLEKISIIDKNAARVQRLRQSFEENFLQNTFISRSSNTGIYTIARHRLQRGASSNRSSVVADEIPLVTRVKPHAFVAMPFKKEMNDIFYYGIQQPVRALDFICERVEQAAFLGDILEQVKKKIETAAVVVADLTDANANVYLEVGYAWGKGRPTILLIHSSQEPRFDVQGQRYLKYESIKNLENLLNKELKELQSKGFL